MFALKTSPSKNATQQLDSIGNMTGKTLMVKFDLQPWTEMQPGSNFLLGMPAVPVRQVGQNDGEYLRVQIKQIHSSLVTERYIWAEPAMIGYRFFQCANRHGDGKKEISAAGMQKSMNNMRMILWPDPCFDNVAVIGNSLNHSRSADPAFQLVEKWKIYGRTAS